MTVLDEGPGGKAPKGHFQSGPNMTPSIGDSSVVVAESRETKAKETSKCRTVEDESLTSNWPTNVRSLHLTGLVMLSTINEEAE